MMMQNPDDNLFQDMLADYAAPVEDDGFTQSLLETIEVEAKRVERIRKVSLYGACFAGGLIAATQLPALAVMAGKIKLAMPVVPSVPDAGVLPVSTMGLAGLVFLGFVLWAALDRQVSEIF